MEMAITRASQGMVRHWIASHGVRPIAAGAGPELFTFQAWVVRVCFFFASRPFQMPRTSELPLSLLWTIQLFPRRLISWPWQLGAAFCHTPCYWSAPASNLNTACRSWSLWNGSGPRSTARQTSSNKSQPWLISWGGLFLRRKCGLE